MTTRIILAALAVTVLILIAGHHGAQGRPSSESDLSNMVEALRVLEQYDKMYSQLARPRFGRSLMPTASESLIPLEDTLEDSAKSS